MRKRLPTRRVTYPSQAPLERVTGLRLLASRAREFREERRTMRGYRRSPFALYGLPETWPGRRGVNGMGWTKGIGINRLSLTHVTTDARAARLNVEVSRGRSLDSRKVDLAEQLLEREIDDDGLALNTQWSSIGIPIEGEMVPFEQMQATEGRWGRGQHAR